MCGKELCWVASGRNCISTAVIVVDDIVMVGVERLECGDTSSETIRRTLNGRNGAGDRHNAAPNENAPHGLRSTHVRAHENVFVRVCVRVT